MKLKIMSESHWCFMVGVILIQLKLRRHNYNPYMTLGSGYESDVLVKARVALQRTVENLMNQYGSEGKAW